MFKDRTAAIIQKLESTSKENPNWKAIKELKQLYTPNYTKLKNIKGERSLLCKRADTIAEYLEQKHWQANESPPMYQRNKIHKDKVSFNERDYSIEEFETCVNKTNNRKAPGPDKIQNELIKQLDKENKHTILNLINKWNKNRRIDPETAEATVVTLFKKGDTQDNANYRPISLLNTIFKIYCAMIKHRIEEQIEKYISPTQYGFRKGRSCSQALHIIRRIIDYGEATN